MSLLKVISSRPSGVTEDQMEKAATILNRNEGTKKSGNSSA